MNFKEYSILLNAVRKNPQVKEAATKLSDLISKILSSEALWRLSYPGDRGSVPLTTVTIDAQGNFKLRRSNFDYSLPDYYDVAALDDRHNRANQAMIDSAETSLNNMVSYAVEQLFPSESEDAKINLRNILSAFYIYKDHGRLPDFESLQTLLGGIVSGVFMNPTEYLTRGVEEALKENTEKLQQLQQELAPLKLTPLERIKALISKIKLTTPQKWYPEKFGLTDTTRWVPVSDLTQQVEFTNLENFQTALLNTLEMLVDEPIETQDFSMEHFEKLWSTDNLGVSNEPWFSKHNPFRGSEQFANAYPGAVTEFYSILRKDRKRQNELETAISGKNARLRELNELKAIISIQIQNILSGQTDTVAPLTVGSSFLPTEFSHLADRDKKSNSEFTTSSTATESQNAVGQTERKSSTETSNIAERADSKMGREASNIANIERQNSMVQLFTTQHTTSSVASDSSLGLTSNSSAGSVPKVLFSQSAKGSIPVKVEAAIDVIDESVTKISSHFLPGLLEIASNLEDAYKGLEISEIIRALADVVDAARKNEQRNNF